MSSFLTDEELRAALALSEAATPGPWHVGHIDESLDRGEIVNTDGIIIASDCKRNDEAFLCAARDLVPRMARELLSLRKWKKQILEDMKDLGMTFAECKIND